MEGICGCHGSPFEAYVGCPVYFRTVAINLKGQLYGFDQDWLDELYAEYEEPEEVALFVEEDFRKAIEETKSVVKRLIELQPGIKIYLKVLAHFYSLWGFLSLQTDDDFDLDAFAQAYLVFMEKVTSAIKLAGSEEVQEEIENTVRIYSANSRGASTDLTPRQARHDQLTLAMVDVAGVVYENC